MSVYREMPVDTPQEGLSETARNLFGAARQIVIRDGIQALTLSAIEKESGVNRALVAYYFGDKRGLVLMLVRDAYHAAARSVLELLQVSFGRNARHLAANLALLAASHSPFRLTHRLLPLALDDPEMGREVAGAYEWYRTVIAQALVRSGFCSTSSALTYGALMTAVVDGLAIQCAIDEEAFDLEDVAQAWAALVAAHAAAPHAAGRDDTLPQQR